MNRRTVLLLAAVAALVALNVWHWWPSPEARGEGARLVTASGFRAEDFRLTAVATESTEARAGTRDLFRPKAPPATAARAAPPPPPPKSPEQLAQEAAQAELAQLKLIAVAFHDTRGEAFMSANGELRVVGQGARIGSRFVVQRITPEAVQVLDPDTSVAGTVAISGN
jgi:hypothetical protein